MLLLPGQRGQDRPVSPRQARRLDLALQHGDLMTQYEDVGVPEEAASLPHRAAAAWGDALRQVGLRFIPRHTLEADAIPDGLNQVAFWVVRRNSDGPTGNSQFTPIAVLIRPDQDCIMGRVPGMQQWVPYPELLRKLTGQVRGDELKYAGQQKSQVEVLRPPVALLRQRGIDRLPEEATYVADRYGDADHPEAAEFAGRVQAAADGRPAGQRV